ncbi:hypothetical protein QYE76_020981 [Lolium multiflorum]|uniref:non-specific serine/threonine protein kinase n=1 Tax=Lolium multiflorum TaxID=4521 RepID=A0AAD8R9R6_LOLMU|nr:hypothetical protein QYE76_020981 [Lolium multiflorum]
MGCAASRSGGQPHPAPLATLTESVYCDNCVDLEEASTDSDSSHNTQVRAAEEASLEPSRFINAFQLIATCSDLDLSGLFQEQKTKLGSPHAVQETLKMIRVAARDVSLSVRRMSNSMVKLQDIRLLSRSMLDLTLSAEVIEVTEAHCVVEVSKSTGDLRAYKEFCTSLWRLLNEEQCGSSSNIQDVSMVGGTLCTKHLVLNE